MASTVPLFLALAGATPSAGEASMSVDTSDTRQEETIADLTDRVERLTDQLERIRRRSRRNAGRVGELRVENAKLRAELARLQGATP